MNTTIGFIGTWVMGKSIVKAGYPVTIYNRSQISVREIIVKGRGK
ncbi:MAG: NAD(P)-binding domain-containing protein [Desulfitobacteriaceae bacterium]